MDLIGKQLGDYRIGPELGRGGMGSVYRAEALADGLAGKAGSAVPIKVFHPHLVQDPGAFERFKREAEIGRRIRHPHVVRTFDIGAAEVEGQRVQYMVMELIEGQTLSGLVKELGTVPDHLLFQIADVISDALNHASLIDGIRLCKAKRLRYAHSDMADLEARLREASDCRLRLIVTDGVFSMHGDLAKLDHIVGLAERYDAAVIVDDSHATGVLGPNGRGTPAHFGVADRIEIVTSTLGKTLGGATGGFTSGKAEVVELLRQRSRPYLFSNSLPPPIVAGASCALELVQQGDHLRQQLRANAAFFRDELTTLGFRLVPGEHPIIPVKLGEAALATSMAEALLNKGVYVVGFSYPVVPQGQARIRTQMSAAHTPAQLQQAVAAFATAGRALGIIP